MHLCLITAKLKHFTLNYEKFYRSSNTLFQTGLKHLFRLLKQNKTHKMDTDTESESWESEDNSDTNTLLSEMDFMQLLGLLKTKCKHSI